MIRRPPRSTRTDTLFPYTTLFRSYGMGTTIWSPLASGLLSGKYNDGVPADSRLAQPGYEWLREGVLGHGDERLGKVRALQPIADELGTSLAQLAIAWSLQIGRASGRGGGCQYGYISVVDGSLKKKN